VIEQAAGGGDQDFDAAAQFGLLDFHVDATEHDGAAQRQMLVVIQHTFMHLDRQFARWRQHQARTGCRAGEALAFACWTIFCSKGSTNAAVLPVPVCACAIRSRPASTNGIAC
jgi:hypothetical protein